MQTDGHWPLAREVPELGSRLAICCECGARPKRIASLAGCHTTWHEVHRAGLRLPAVDYTWDGEASGLSTGGYLDSSQASG